MTLHRLSAGTGYQYLLRHIATGDASPTAGTSLTGYYAGSGYPPGEWLGAGLAGLGAANQQLAAGDTVTEQQMARLFGAGHDPLTGQPLGRAYPVFAPAAERVARRVSSLPATMSEQQRAAAVAEIEHAEAERTQPAAVAGFDLTFTVPKSASVLWGLGDEGQRAAVLAAHHAAVADTLGVVEQRALFTRTGAGGVAQVPTAGMVAAAFLHWDTRTGDPNLHSHVVVANRVQGPDGKWRSVDSRTLHHAAVFASELYDDLLADHLAARLPVRWGWRDRGPRRTTAFELDGVDDRLLAAFSTRSSAIDQAVTASVREFTLSHGRRPTRTEVVRLRQTATLATRPAKTPHRLTDLLARWATTARRVTGRPPADTVTAVTAVTGQRRAPLRNERIGDTTVHRLADLTITDVMARRSTWNDWNLLAAAARVTRGLRLASATDRLALLDRVHAATVDRCTSLSGADPIGVVPAELRRPDGASVFTRAGETPYSHPALLAAEQRLLAAHLDTTAPSVPAAGTDWVATRMRADPDDPATAPARLAADQAAAVATIAGSGRSLDVLVGPAGTGKTTALLALRVAWEQAHGRGSVVGLAPSAAAAHQLGAAIGVTCENVTKWLHETTPHAVDDRAALLAAIPHRRQRAAAAGNLGTAAALGRLARQLREDTRRWQLRPGQLLIVDEASLAGTLDLDTLRDQAQTAGAKLLLVGDHHQLSAVDAGGAFRLLATDGHPARLGSLWRFRHRWEAHATRQLRDGELACVDAYAAHGRVHHGPAEVAIDDAYTAWAADTAAGHTALLVAPDNHTATALNQRAHLDRTAAGHVTGPTVLLGDGCAADRGRAGAGDVVVTRHNDRQLHVAGTDGRRGHVRNGARWTVTAVHPDGSLDITPHQPGNPDQAGWATVRLPAEYVAAHLDLGYATTAHRAQGLTVDRCHVLVSAGATREALYVAMTRGRDANHLYLSTDAVGPDCVTPGSQPDQGPREQLATILATSGSERSATETLRGSADDAASLRRLAPIRATVAATIDHRRWPALLRDAGLADLLVADIADSPAAGPLYAALRRGEGLGHHMPRVAARLLASTPIPTETDPAAVLHHRVQTWLATAPDLTDPPTGEHTASRRCDPAAAVLAISERSPVVAGDVLDPLLDAVDDAIAERIARLTDTASASATDDVLAASADLPAEVRQRLAVVAAHHDLTNQQRPERSRTQRQRDRHAALATTRLGHRPERSTA